MFETRKQWQELQEAAQQDDAAKITALVAAGLRLKKEKRYYDACVTAIRSGASEALDALLTEGRFNFCKKMPSIPHSAEDREDIEDKKLVFRLIKEAGASPKAESLLPVLYSHGKNMLVPREFLNENSSISVLKVCLEKKYAYAFSECVTRTGLPSAEIDKLEFILAFDGGNNADTLGRALITVATRGDVKKVALLLKYKASADYDNVEALHRAALNKHKEIVDLLLPYVSLDFHGAKIVTKLKHEEADLAIIQSIEAATQKTLQKTAAEAAPTQSLKGRFNRLSETVLEEVLPPSGESKETVRYYFETEQQVFMKDGTPTLAVNFNSLGEGVVKTMRAILDDLAPEQSKSAALKLRQAPGA